MCSMTAHELGGTQYQYAAHSGIEMAPEYQALGHTDLLQGRTQHLAGGERHPPT